MDYEKSHKSFFRQRTKARGSGYSRMDKVKFVEDSL